MWSPKILLAFAAACMLAAITPRFSAAQRITIDGRFSPAQTLIGPNYAITANLGKQVGGNLFHSFGQFGLSAGESATFSGPATVANVIGRVTGGNASSIDGKVQSNIAGANLYLINPGGIVFAPNATVNVSGSFHASTADYVKMTDGAKFQATNPDASTLSSASPAAFGFLSARPAAVTVNGGNIGPVSGTLGIVGGPVSISGAKLSAPAGTIHIASAAGTGEVSVDPRNTSASTVTSFGPVHLGNGTKLDTSDPVALGSGGSVFIRAGTLTIDASEINLDNYGRGAGGQLALRSDNGITLSDGTDIHALAASSGRGADAVLASAGDIVLDNGTVRVGSLATGASGNLSVGAGGTLGLKNGGLLAASTAGTGAPGMIQVSANDLAIGPLASITNVTFGQQPAGDITVTVAGELTIQGKAAAASIDIPMFGVADGCFGCPGTRPQTGITSQSLGAGNAGNVTISAGKLSIVGIGAIGSVVAEPGSGNAGSVSVNVAGELSVDGGISTIPADQRALDDCCAGNLQPIDQFRSGIVAEAMAGNGNAGTVTVNAGSLHLANEGQIVANTFGAGQAGDVSVKVGGPALLDNGYIMANSNGATGNAGTVSVSAPTLDVVSGGAIWSGAHLGFGNAGDVFIDVPGQMTVDGGTTGFASIFAWTLGNQGSGGLVKVHAGDLLISGGGIISSLICICASGNGGTTIVNVDRSLTIDGKAQPAYVQGFATGITSDTSFSVGNAGSVIVTTRDLTILNNGQISSSTLNGSLGNGGDVFVTADRITIDARGSDPTRVGIPRTGPPPPVIPPPSPPTGIVAETEGAGNAGKITVNAGTLTLLNGGVISSSTSGSGNGGEVFVNVAGALTMDGTFAHPLLATGIFARTTGDSTGDGGRINVSAGTITLPVKTSISSATVGPGTGGDIRVDAGSIRLSGPGPRITAQSTGSGDAGSITVSAIRLSMDNGAAISTEADTSTASGGNITLHVRDFLYLLGSEITTSVKGETGNGGNIAIDPQVAILNRSSIVAEAIEGHGGDITITAGEFIPSSDSITSATSRLGISGTVEINGPRVDVNGALVVLSSELRGRAAVLREACAARSDRPISSLVEAGRGGSAQDPEETLPALYVAGRDVIPNVPSSADTLEASGDAVQTNLHLKMRCG